jgi:hypothetical protein
MRARTVGDFYQALIVTTVPERVGLSTAVTTSSNADQFFVGYIALFILLPLLASGAVYDAHEDSLVKPSQRLAGVLCRNSDVQEAAITSTLAFSTT